MDQKLKVIWIDALCSGRFPQSKCSLRNSSGYCCLGVLAEVAGVTSSGNSFIESRKGVYLFLPGYIQKELARLNDEEVPFEIIAGLISEAL